MEISEATSVFLASRRARNLRPKTLEYYQWCLDYLDQALPLPNRPVEVELILGAASDHLSPASLRDLWRGLRIFYRWLGSRYPGQAVNPIEETTAYGQRILHVYPPSVPPTIPRTLTYQQLHKLLTLGCVCRQDRAFVLLILDTGIRLNAWCEL